MRKSFLYIFCILFFACDSPIQDSKQKDSASKDGQELIVLGIAQDAGYPQVACKKDCCKEIMNHPEKGALVSCLSLIDHDAQKYYFFDATPDFRSQYNFLQNKFPAYQLGGIFLTHAHIGHYTGLMQLGREVIGSKKINVYAMPRMKSFIESNGPWSQLVELENITLLPLFDSVKVMLNSSLWVAPFRVPHRDEFSETVGFKIQNASRSALFIPDINKWNVWEKDLKEEVAQVDYAFLDATFYQESELPGRNMAEIPHPFVPETKAVFSKSIQSEKAKIHFIHLNHSNDLLRKNSAAYKETIAEGFKVAEQFQALPF